MAFDLKIEIFAYALFRKTWFQMDLVKTKPNILQIYGEECCKVKKIYEACDDLYIKPIICRRNLFKRIYLRDFRVENVRSLKSLSECYNYVVSKCDSEDFSYLSVFEKMFATCAFVLDFCIHIHQYNIVNVIEYGHMFWAMYFDKFSKEFYEKGGWSELKIAAKTYRDLDVFFCLFNELSFVELGEGIEDYYDFIVTEEYDEYKKQIEGTHISKLWIKYRMERFEKYCKIMFTKKFSCNSSKAEEILRILKELYEILEYEEIYYESSDYTDDERNTDDNFEIEDLPDPKHETQNKFETQCTNQMHKKLDYRDSVSYNVQCAIFSSDTECAVVNKEINTAETLKMSNSSKYVDDLKNIETKTNERTETSTSHVDKYRLVENSSLHILPSRQFIDTYIENLYSENTEKLKETHRVIEDLSAFEDLSTNQMNKPLCSNNLPSCRVPEMLNICSENDEVSKERELEDIHNSKSVENQTETGKRTEILSASNVDKDKYRLNENSFHILPSRQFIDTCIENLYSENTERLKETQRVIEVLSAFEDLSTNQTNKPLSSKNLPSCGVPEMLNICCENDEVSKERELEETFYSKSVVNQTETDKRTEISSASNVDKYGLNENSSLHILPSKQFIDTCIENLYSENTERSRETQRVIEVLPTIQLPGSELDGKNNQNILPTSKDYNPDNQSENTENEMKNSGRAGNDLKNEQKDRCNKIFLRMIMVLDDRPGTELLFQTLQRIKEPKKTNYSG